MDYRLIMPDALFESIVKVTHDPDGTPFVLVDYGDDLTSEISLEASQEVDEISFVRASGIKTEARGNEANRLMLPLAHEDAGITDAIEGLMNRSISVPRHSADVLIETESGWKWRIKNATIKSWSGRVSDQFSERQIEIIGGELVLIDSPL